MYSSVPVKKHCRRCNKETDHYQVINVQVYKNGDYSVNCQPKRLASEKPQVACEECGNVADLREDEYLLYYDYFNEYKCPCCGGPTLEVVDGYDGTAPNLRYKTKRVCMDKKTSGCPR